MHLLECVHSLTAAPKHYTDTTHWVRPVRRPLLSSSVKIEDNIISFSSIPSLIIRVKVFKAPKYFRRRLRPHLARFAHRPVLNCVPVIDSNFAPELLVPILS